MSNGCEMCAPSPHENAGVYTTLTVSDPATGHERVVDVCKEHFEAVKPHPDE